MSTENHNSPILNSLFLNLKSNDRAQMHIYLAVAVIL